MSKHFWIRTGLALVFIIWAIVAFFFYASIADAQTATSTATSTPTSTATRTSTSTPTRTPSPTYTQTPTRTATPTSTLIPTVTPTGTSQSLTAVARTSTAIAQRTSTAATGTPTPWRTPGTPALFAGNIALRLVQATAEATSAVPTPWSTCVSAGVDGETTVLGSFTSLSELGGGKSYIDNTDFVSGAGSLRKEITGNGWSRHYWIFPTPWAINHTEADKTFIIEYDFKMVETPTGSSNFNIFGELARGGNVPDGAEMYYLPIPVGGMNYKLNYEDGAETYFYMPDGQWNNFYFYADQQTDLSPSTTQTPDAPGEVLSYLVINGTPIPSPTVSGSYGQERGRLVADITGDDYNAWLWYYNAGFTGVAKARWDNVTVSLCVCEDGSCFYTGEAAATATPTITPAPTYPSSEATVTPQPITRAWISEVFPRQGYTCRDWNLRGGCGDDDLYVEWYTAMDVLSGGWTVEIANSTCTYTAPSDSRSVGWKVAWLDDFRKPGGSEGAAGVYCDYYDFPLSGIVTLRDATGEVLDTRDYYINETQKGLSWAAYVSSYPAGNWGTMYPSPGR